MSISKMISWDEYTEETTVGLTAANDLDMPVIQNTTIQQPQATSMPQFVEPAMVTGQYAQEIQSASIPGVRLTGSELMDGLKDLEMTG